MKKNIISVILFVLVISVCLCVILITNNNKLSDNQNEITSQSNTNIPSKSEANQITDEQLIEKIISGEEILILDNIEDDTILTNIDAILNENNTLVDMPGE